MPAAFYIRCRVWGLPVIPRPITGAPLGMRDRLEQEANNQLDRRGLKKSIARKLAAAEKSRPGPNRQKLLREAKRCSTPKLSSPARCSCCRRKLSPPLVGFADRGRDTDLGANSSVRLISLKRCERILGEKLAKAA